MRQIIAAIAGLVMLGACGGSVPDDAVIIEVSDGFIVKPIAGRDMTGGGMSVTVTNGAQTLVGAETDAADRVEFHTMGIEDGRMQMRQVSEFGLDSETPLVLKRGGDHLMLFGLKPGLDIGDEIDVVLQFDDGQGKDQFIVAKMDVVGPGD
jgi:copper(I)-binding protein